jgi:branched-subunit amino acid aminotransferase/4-amino-4-deoxychorismate lyase
LTETPLSPPAPQRREPRISGPKTLWPSALLLQERNDHGGPRRPDLAQRQLVDWREAKTHVLTHTLHYGMGVFEGVRAYKTERGRPSSGCGPYRRLFNSAHILGMRVPYRPRHHQRGPAHAAVRENGLESAYIRPMFYYGAEGMGLRADNLNVHCIVAAWDWGAYLGEENMKHGIRIRCRRSPATTSTSPCAGPRPTATT